MTADGPVGYYLSRLYKAKWFSSDIEQEAGCGIVPIEYKNTSLVHAWQWAIGLEWYLLVNDPWRIAMSTDHPNGGSFLAYPQIIRLLMDRTYRREMLKTLPAAVRERTMLRDLDREYSLSEIAIITRAGPARMLGLRNKGHLGVGADADVTIYTPDANAETMFATAAARHQGGPDAGRAGRHPRGRQGKTLHVAPDYDRGVEADIRDWFEDAYSIQMAELPGRRTLDRGIGSDRVNPTIEQCRSPSCTDSLRARIVADTFAEAFPMTAARVIVTADTPEWAEIAGQTMTGYATSVIACDAEAGVERELATDRDARRPAGREHPGLRLQPRRAREGPGQPGRSVRDDLPDDGLLQRPAARREDDQRRRPAAVLRRRLADLEEDRRPALLADPSDGRRVPLRGDLRDGQGGRRRQHHRAWGPTPRRRSQPPKRPSPRCAATAATSSCPSPAGSPARVRRLAASTRACGPARTRPSRRRSAASSPPRCRRTPDAPTRS